MKKHLGIIGLLAAAAMLQAVELVRDGQLMFNGIVTPEKPVPMAALAAKELAYHLKLATGTELPVITEKAVKSGYWATYRYNPELVGTDKNPFTLDSKEPTESFQAFLQGEVRFSSLKRAFPEIAEELYAKTERDAKARLEGYKKLAGQA